jgi:hypothetical protein
MKTRKVREKIRIIIVNYILFDLLLEAELVEFELVF